MWYAVTFVTGTVFGFTIAACCVMAKRGDNQ